jgi:putative membrane protein
MYPDWSGPWHMWSAWGFWWVFPLAMIALLIAVCVFFMAGMSGAARREDRTGSAIRLLNERFAKGEISKEEFEERRNVLAGQP